MKRAPYRAIGGSIITDHGPIPLAHARDLARFYDCEAEAAPDNVLARACRVRAETLRVALIEASHWRRAAGWTDPDAADRPISPRPLLSWPRAAGRRRGL